MEMSIGAARELLTRLADAMADYPARAAHLLREGWRTDLRALRAEVFPEPLATKFRQIRAGVRGGEVADDTLVERFFDFVEAVERATDPAGVVPAVPPAKFRYHRRRDGAANRLRALPAGLTVQEVADRLQISVGSAHNLIRLTGYR